MLTPEVKYAKDKVYPGNAPFKRHNQQKYIERKEKEDALRKEEEAKKVEPIAEIKL
jgi:hypothetical protein